MPPLAMVVMLEIQLGDVPGLHRPLVAVHFVQPLLQAESSQTTL